MSVTTRAAELAASFERLNNDVIGLVNGCDDEQWQRTTTAEGWTVAATAHHLAIVQRAFVGIVEVLAAGKTYTPAIDMDAIHKSNAEHAVEFAAADKSETLEILQSSGDDMAALIRGFDDAGLDRIAGSFGGNDMTVAQFIEYVVIGHNREHGDSVREAIAG